MIELFILITMIAVAGWVSVSMAIQSYKLMVYNFGDEYYIEGIFNLILFLCSPLIFAILILLIFIFTQIFYILITGQI